MSTMSSPRVVSAKVSPDSRAAATVHPGRFREKRYARWHWDDDGSFVFTARLRAETGALLRQAITESIELGPADHHERAADAFTDVIERALTFAAVKMSACSIISRFNAPTCRRVRRSTTRSLLRSAGNA
jgi:hypothetical protein